MSNYAYDRAIDDFTKWTEIEPDNAEAYRYRSIAHAKNHNNNRALNDYNHAIKMTREQFETGDRWFEWDRRDITP
jgi:Flp pilus assembly protein TadD